MTEKEIAMKASTKGSKKAPLKKAPLKGPLIGLGKSPWKSLLGLTVCLLLPALGAASAAGQQGDEGQSATQDNPTLEGQADDNQDNPALTRLVELLGEAETLQAEVEQLILDQNGRQVQQASARLVMRKPDHFYWHATEPYEEVMTTNGERIWIYEPDLEQVTIQDFSNDLSRTPALLLSEDKETLQESFEVSFSERNGETHFNLLPRGSGSLFESLTLVFADEVLKEMHFEDSLGQQTSMSFRQVQVNEPVDEELFSFEAPPGVEVIDSTGG